MSIDARRAAAAAGQSSYVSDQPCAYGHKAIRLVINGTCAECARLATNKSKQRSRDALREAQRQARA